MKKNLIALIFVVIYYVFSPHTVSGKEGNTLIEGFTKWQANRIERIVVDEALSDIVSNPYVNKFFEKTAGSIQFYDSISAKRLLPLMQAYVVEDLNIFDEISSCIKHKAKIWLKAKGEKQLENSAKEFQSLTISISKLVSKLPPKPGERFFSASDFLVEQDCRSKNKNAAAGKNLVQEFTVNKNDLEYFAKKIAPKIESMLKEQKTIVVLSNIDSKLIISAEAYIKKFIALLEDIERSIETMKRMNDDKLNYIARVHNMLVVLDFFGTSESDISSFNRLKSIVLFLASLVDASEKNSDAVAGVLNEFVDEQDTHNRKRQPSAYYSTISEYKFSLNGKKKTNYSVTCKYLAVLPCKDTLFLSSYYGLSIMNLDENNSGENKWTGRFYGPVGIELKILSLKGSPVTLGYAPVDLGNYITAELKGDSYDAKTEDVLSPSWFLSWSSSSRPFSILLGHQRDIKIDNGLTDDSYFLSFAFDLPIATIY